MTFGRWIWDRQRQRMVPADEYHARKSAQHARADLPCPAIISDAIELKSMVDGKIYTSKAALRRSYRARGHVESGSEEQKPAPKRAPDRKAIRASVGKAFARAGIAT